MKHRSLLVEEEEVKCDEKQIGIKTPHGRNLWYSVLHNELNDLHTLQLVELELVGKEFVMG